MLLSPVFRADGEADRRIAEREEREMIAATAEAIRPAIDEHVEPARQCGGDSVHRLGERAAGAIVFTAERAADHLLVQIFRCADAF